MTVRNVGDREGKESVLLFSSDLCASIVPDIRRLRAFDKIELAPGEAKVVRFSLPATSLAFVGADGKWRLESGDFDISCGTERLRVKCVSDKVWDEPNID